MTAHRWKFRRTGGVDQVVLSTGADLAALPSLDPKLWAAVAMPTKGVHLDGKTLAALDADGDGRVRVPEVLAAVAWCGKVLRSLDEIIAAGDGVALEAIADPALAAGARRVLANLGKADATTITLADVADTTKVFAGTRFNGDGVVPVDAGDDAALQQILSDIIATHGSTKDRSGKDGVDGARVDAFFAEVRALAAWDARADATTQPLGDGTAAAFAALSSLRAKLDDFFTRCRLATFDGRTAAALGGSDADLLALSSRELAPGTPELARLPLARVGAGATVPLDGAVNPAWADAVTDFATRTVAPLLGARDTLDEKGWRALQGKLAAHAAWIADKPTTAVEKLGLARVRAVAASDGEARVRALVAEDLALADENAQLAALEKLLLFKRDLALVLDNFVNFSRFYALQGAVFQAGSLLLDGRSCALCVEVADVARHASLAALSGIYLAYCDVARGAEKRTIAAAFTDGDAENLMVGRNGVFYDRDGKDWDATVTKILANPISVREAFWAPYKKAARLVEEQVTRRAVAAETAANTQLAATATELANADAAKAPAPAAAVQQPRARIDVGTVAAIGVAIGGIGAMVTGVLSAFFGLGAWMPIGLVGVVLAVSGPSMLLAFLKLRQRNIGPLLDANGWAVNGRVRINVPFGAALTSLARLPAGAERRLDDPYAEKKRPWRAYTAAAVVLALASLWVAGRLDGLLPEKARADVLLHRSK